jgi:predicted Fe-Mo cluster-binding NifX family protein
MLGCFKSKYLSFFSAHRFFRHAGIDVIAAKSRSRGDSSELRRRGIKMVNKRFRI